MARFQALAAVGLLFASPALAADPAAEAFVRELYRPYAESDAAPGRDVAELRRLFTPSTAALIVRDRRQAAARNEAPALNGDPLVDSQEWTPTPIDLAVEDGRTPGTARARASYTVPAGRERRAVELDLVRTRAGWRVADIRWAGEPKSLRQLLTRR